MKKIFYLGCLLTTFSQSAIYASPISADNLADSDSIKIFDKPKDRPINKFYLGGELDALIFSSAFIDDNGATSLGTLRFTGFFHYGHTLHFNFNKSIGVFTGLQIKNIGFIEKFKTDDATMKQRVYTLGLPVAFKLGDMVKENYVFLGGGVDLPFHYKEKYWDKNTSKTKESEWFSKKVETILPYVFVGYAIKGSTVKLSYYPNNFLNEDYTFTDGSGITHQPYKGKQVGLFMVSLGIPMRF